MPERSAVSARADPVPSAAQAEAAAHDAAGRHSEAIAVLSRAAAAGDLAAKRTVGLRILLGDRAPYLGPQGLRLVSDAAGEGDAVAAEISAVLAGGGIHGAQDWVRALDWLQHAAELGSSRARGALAVLCSDPELSSRIDAPAPPAGLWRRLRDHIDLASWLAPPPARLLSADPSVRTYPGFVDARMCRWLIANARRKLARAEVYNPSTRVAQSTPERTNSVAHSNLLDTDLAQILLQARIGNAVGLPFANFEPLAILHYDPGEAFLEHYDFVDPDEPQSGDDFARNGQRLFTFLIYLNGDYEGGETSFPRLSLHYKGEVGEGLVFRNVLPNGAPDRRTLHAGRSPRSGEKWLMSQFVRDRQIVPGATPSPS